MDGASSRSCRPLNLLDSAISVFGSRPPVKETPPSSPRAGGERGRGGGEGERARKTRVARRAQGRVSLSLSPRNLGSGRSGTPRDAPSSRNPCPRKSRGPERVLRVYVSPPSPGGNGRRFDEKKKLHRTPHTYARQILPTVWRNGRRITADIFFLFRRRVFSRSCPPPSPGRTSARVTA